MSSIQRPGKDCATIIRPTSGYEITAEEKRKLDSVEENAQENVIEIIEVNDEALPIDHNTKTAKMQLGSLAFKDKITQDDLTEELLPKKDVFYFSFVLVNEATQGDRIFTTPYEFEADVQLVDCSIDSVTLEVEF